MLTIGEFSRASGLTIKALRFYHEQGLLTPAYIEPGSGYRHYDSGQLETARVITTLRELEFSINEIAEILRQTEADLDLLTILKRQRSQLGQRAQHYRQLVRQLDQVIAFTTQEQTTMPPQSFDVVEKELPAITLAAVRMRARYDECGQGFKQIGRKLGRYLNGKPMLLHYDLEYREHDANYEACFPVKGGKSSDGIEVKELAGGRAVTLIHLGPYQELTRSYDRIMRYLDEHHLEAECPTREVYLKGPGLIFRGNPKKYLTEIQILVHPRP